MTQVEPPVPNEEQLQLQKQQLELAKERFEFERTRQEWEYEQRVKALEIEQKQAQVLSEQKLKELELSEKIANLELHTKEAHTRYRGYIAAGVLKSVTSTMMIGAGVYFTSIGNDLSPYILGTGATGIGIEASRLLKTEDKKSSEKEAQNRDEPTEK